MARRFFKRRYLVILIIFALTLPLVSFGSSLEYFRLSSGVKEFFKTVSDRGQRQTNTSVADYNITNNCGLDYFAPNNSKLEWDSFLANKPSCLVQTYASCGDAICQATHETYSNCSSDCAPVCGDGFCAGEDCVTCTDDCGLCCGNCFCDHGETRITCRQDCAPIGYCGDGVCSCPICNPHCAVCQDCEDSYNCPEDCGVCGDGFCDGNETKATCYTDCGAPVVCPYCPPYENCNPCEALR